MTMKKSAIIGLCLALSMSHCVFAVDIGSAIDSAMESSGNVTTEQMRFGDVDFAVPAYYVKDEESTNEQLKYHISDQQIDLTFYLGDYTNSTTEFEETKKDIVTNIVAGMPDGEIVGTEDSNLAGFNGIRFDFTSNVDDVKHISYGGYYYNDTKQKYIIILLSSPEDVDMDDYLSQYEKMIETAKIDDEFLEVYADMLRDYGTILDAIDKEDYGEAMNGLADLYGTLGELGE